MTRKLLQGCAVVCWLLGCSQPAAEAPAKPAAAAAPAVVQAPKAAVSPAAAAPQPAAPAAPVVPVVAAPVAPEGPPRKVVTGEGISITEASDGRVILKTTALWGEAIDTTYADCGYYGGAVPVLATQLAPERARLLKQVCAKPRP